MVALSTQLSEDVHSVPFQRYDFNFRFVHLKVIYCWGKPPIWVIRFIPESDANILWMSCRFHRQPWYLKREKKRKFLIHTQVVPDLQDVQLHVGARHRVPEAQPGNHYALWELPPPDHLDELPRGSSHCPGFHIAQSVKGWLARPTSAYTFIWPKPLLKSPHSFLHP